MNFGMKCIASIGRAISYVLILMPRRVRYAIGDVLGWLWFDLFRIRRDIVLANLDRAFPEWSYSKKVRVGRHSLQNLGRDLMEYCELPFYTREKAEKNFEIEGIEHLERARAQGRGVCLLTLHLGNGDLAIGALSLIGIPMYLISKEFKLKWLNNLWFGMRARLGTKFIPPRNSSYAVLKALKKQGVVVFVLDQFTGPPIGVKTRFFGHETGTGLGLATIAQRSNCPVIPVYTFRMESGKHLIRFEPEIPLSQDSDNDQALKSTTQAYNDRLEDYVKKCPEQWMWIHKRWKIFKV